MGYSDILQDITHWRSGVTMPRWLPDLRKFRLKLVSEMSTWRYLKTSCARYEAAIGKVKHPNDSYLSKVCSDKISFG